MKQTKEEKTKHQYPHQHKHQESRVDTHTIFNVKLIYGLLLLVRILITTRLSGYIHPDEFFQGGQELFYGCSSCSMPCSKPNVNGDQDVDIVKNNCHYQEDKEDEEYQVLKRYQLHTFLDHNNEETFLKTNSNAYSTNSTAYYPLQSMASKFVHQILNDSNGNNNISNDTFITATWEYQPNFAIRSIMPPFIMTKLPLQFIYLPLKRFCSFVGSHHDYDHRHQTNFLNGKEIWIVPRIFMSILSILIIDATIYWYISKINSSMTAAFNNQDIIHTITSSSSSPSTTITATTDNTTTRNNYIIMILYSTSWTTLVFLNRPFSNTLETIFLTILFFLVMNDLYKSLIRKCKYEYASVVPHLHQYTMYVIMGIICSMGVFTRFTFCIFAFPIVVSYVHTKSKLRSTTTRNIRSSESSSSSSSMSTTTATTKSNFTKLNHHYYLREFCTISLFVLFGFAITSYLLILLDSEFYTILKQQQQQQQQQSGDGNYFVITPWNALRYNSQSSNLSHHGIHPRITHAFVNLPMLFGPLAFYFYYKCMYGVFTKTNYMFVRGSNDTQMQQSPTATAGTINNPVQQLRNIVNGMCYGMIMFGIGILSCAPHQEPRFLLPLILPLVLVYVSHINYTSKSNTQIIERYNMGKQMMNMKVTFLWILFNTILLFFFGIMHQGALIPSLLHVSNTIANEGEGVNLRMGMNAQPTAIVLFHTYMPPSFLLRHDHYERIDSKSNVDTLNKNKINDHVCQANNKCLESSSFEEFNLETTCPHLPIIDLKDFHLDYLITSLESILQCEATERMNNNESMMDNNYVYLVAPPVVVKPLWIKNRENIHRSTLIWNKMQIATEDINGGPLSDILRLDLYVVQCQI
jgi:phosphatidylinositol glycan class Z